MVAEIIDFTGRGNDPEAWAGTDRNDPETWAGTAGNDEEADSGNRKCRELSCFANKEGICDALCDTDFGKRRCPFFKTREDNATDQLDALQRLVDSGRFDLIEKYRDVMEELGILGYEDSFFDEHRDTVDYLKQLRELERQLKADPDENPAADTPDMMPEWQEDEWDDEWADGAREDADPEYTGAEGSDGSL